LGLFFITQNRPKHKNAHKSLLSLNLQYFAYFNIGFVFSNIPFQLVSDFVLSASNFQPKAGELALFFQTR